LDGERREKKNMGMRWTEKGEGDGYKITNQTCDGEWFGMFSCLILRSTVLIHPSFI